MLADDDVALPVLKPVSGETQVTSSSPVNTRQIGVTLDGVQTDIVYQMFADKLFIIAIDDALGMRDHICRYGF